MFDNSIKASNIVQTQSNNRQTVTVQVVEPVQEGRFSSSMLLTLFFFTLLVVGHRRRITS